MKMPEVTLEMTPCAYCGMLLHLPFLTVDDKKYCGWECYGKHREETRKTDDSPATTEHE